MFRRTRKWFVFVRFFLTMVRMVWLVLLSIALLIVVGGIAFSEVEHLPLGKAIYFAFVTALTIGYGDITPQTAAGRVLSVVLGLIGVVFVGLTVAVATRALAETVRQDRESEH
jgi:voltage-gated potassium channel Kch